MLTAIGRNYRRSEKEIENVVAKNKGYH
jgi:hypothetical protein